jgi:DNA-directed RNA polymerase
MFLFANGEAIGEEGIYWLKVHVANCGAFDKIDKKPIEERVKWVDENLTPDVTDVATSPASSNLWSGSGQPVPVPGCLRGACFGPCSEGPTYVATLPVSFDGSCSGTCSTWLR